MYKKFFLVFLFCLFTSTIIIAQENINSWDNYSGVKLNGKVKSIHGVQYDVHKTGTIEKNQKGFASYTEKLNEAGNITEVTSFNEKGKENSKQIFKYNISGKLIEYRDSAFGSVTVQTYKYDDKGNKTEKCKQNKSGKIFEKYINSFDSNGNLIEHKVYGIDGVLQETIKYKYDDNGNLTEVVKYASNNLPESTEAYKYNEKGKKITYSFYNKDYILEKTSVYLYDEKDSLDEIERFDAFGKLISKDIFGYDANGNLISENDFDANGNITFKTSYMYILLTPYVREKTTVNESGYKNTLVYDDQYIKEGNKIIIEDNTYNPDGSLDFQKIKNYEYDDKGNWIKETSISFADKNPDFIVTREIEYYN